MKSATIPVDLHKVKSEKMKRLIIEAIETIREGKSIPMTKKPPSEWLIRMNTFWKSKKEEARARGGVWIQPGHREGVLRGRSFDTDGLVLILMHGSQ